MKIYASGGSGTIGRFLPESITKTDFRLEDFSDSEIQISSGDIFIHLAGLVGAQQVRENVKLAEEVNVRGVLKLADLSLQREVSKFVFISTSHVYQKRNDPISESSSIEPLSLYAEQKYSAEIQLTNLFEMNPEKLLILRLFSILDYGTQEYTLGGAITKLTEGRIRNIPYGDDVRDFLTPKQAAFEISHISRIENAYGVINLCTGEPIKISEAVSEMLASRNFTTNNPQFILPGNSETPYIVGRPSKFESVTGKKLRWAYKSNFKE